MRLPALLSTLLLPVLLLSGPTQADPWYRPEGRLALGTSSEGAFHAIAVVDLTFALPLAGEATFELGTLQYILRSKNPHETYAGFAFRNLRLGVVRPAYDLAVPSPFEHLAPDLAYELAEATRAHATVEAMRRTAVPWGLSYEGGQPVAAGDGLRWAVSAHHAAKGGFSAVSAMLDTRRGDWRIAGAIEQVWDRNGTAQGTNAKLRLTRHLPRGALSLTWHHPGANGLSQAVSVEATARLTPRLGLTGFGSVFAKDRDVYAIGASYALSDRHALSVSATQRGAQHGLHLTLHHRF